MAAEGFGAAARHSLKQQEQQMIWRFASATSLFVLGGILGLSSPRGVGAGQQRPRFPTKPQFLDSAEAQRHVAVARALAKSDLLPEFENSCSSTGPQWVASARQDAFPV